MAKRTVLKLSAILAGTVCICFMAAGLAGRVGADTYKEKPAGADNLTISSANESLLPAASDILKVKQGSTSVTLDDDIYFTGGEFRIQ